MRNQLMIFAGCALALAMVPQWVVTSETADGAPRNEFSGPTEKAVFAGGCFWGLQAAFDGLPGVVATRVGYTGGAIDHPTYEIVVAGGTGHAEAVEVVFDPATTQFEDLVRHFFENHRVPRGDPPAGFATRHYRSSIFVNGPEQLAIARKVIAERAEVDGSSAAPATLIESAGAFWEAEAYHQNYLSNCRL
jgi:methionine-S-sulfoxide reductase